MTPYSKMNGAASSGKQTPRMKQQYQYSGSVTQGMGNTGMSTDYSYQSLSNAYTNNNNTLYGNDPTQIMNGDTSPLANTSPYSACSLSPGTPTSYQNGTVNNSWPYHQGSLNNYNDNSSSQLLSQNRQVPNGYGSTSTYTTLTNGIWNGMGMGENSSQVVPHGDHSMKVA